MVNGLELVIKDDEKNKPESFEATVNDTVDFRTLGYGEYLYTLDLSSITGYGRNTDEAKKDLKHQLTAAIKIISEFANSL